MLTHEGTLHFGVGAITGIEDTIAAEVMIAGDMSTLFVLANQLSTATQWTTLLVVCLLLLG